MLFAMVDSIVVVAAIVTTLVVAVRVVDVLCVIVVVTVGVIDVVVMRKVMSLTHGRVAPSTGGIRRKTYYVSPHQLQIGFHPSANYSPHVELKLGWHPFTSVTVMNIILPV